MDGERLESQEAVIIGDAGFRVLLVATDPSAPARAAPRTARWPPVRAEQGTVVFGRSRASSPRSSNDRLNIYYMLDIVNRRATPVDIGGPLVFELPHEARGATVMQGSTPQATAKGPRVTVTVRSRRASTLVQVGYELPYGGPTARLRAGRGRRRCRGRPSRAADSASSTSRRRSCRRSSAATEQGQPLIVATGPPLPAGQALVVDITGLPHHPRWPR